MTDDPPEFVAWNTAIKRAAYAHAFRRARIEEYCPLCGKDTSRTTNTLCWTCWSKRRKPRSRKGKA